jgi:hypothetical protein
MDVTVTDTDGAISVNMDINSKPMTEVKILLIFVFLSSAVTTWPLCETLRRGSTRTIQFRFPKLYTVTDAKSVAC